MEEKIDGFQKEYTLDGTVDHHGRPACRARTGQWSSGILLLVNQGLATLAFYGVLVNLVLFLTRVMGQTNANAANNVSKWTGTVYLFALLSAYLSDSYWGRYKTCAVFQAIFMIGLLSLSLSSYLFLVKPSGCGDKETPCKPHSSTDTLLFYVSIYLVALGYGGYQPIIATFGADQFDESHVDERNSKVAFFGYFYLALNVGQVFSNTILGYFEDGGMWFMGFAVSTGSAVIALVLFVVGAPRYRHFIPKGNPLARFSRVVVAAIRKWKVEVPKEDGQLYEVKGMDQAGNGDRKIHHSNGLGYIFMSLRRFLFLFVSIGFLDRAAVMTQKDEISNPWRLCTVTQVEEVKCILRLLPIWLCTIIYSVVFTQMTSLFVEQGNAMETTVAGFDIPPASMSAFEIVSAAAFILMHTNFINPIFARNRKSGELTELERMGIGLAVASVSMAVAGIVEHFRLREAIKESSNLTIFCQVPQYVLIGASEAYMLVGQLEFFNAQAPDGLKSFGSALSMTSISLRNYASSLIVSLVMKVSSSGEKPGWIPRNLNRGHVDGFFYLLAVLTATNLLVYVVCAKFYRYTRFQERGNRTNRREILA